MADVRGPRMSRPASATPSTLAAGTAEASSQGGNVCDVSNAALQAATAATPSLLLLPQQQQQRLALRRNSNSNSSVVVPVVENPLSLRRASQLQSSPQPLLPPPPPPPRLPHRPRHVVGNDKEDSRCGDEAAPVPPPRRGSAPKTTTPSDDGEVFLCAVADDKSSDGYIKPPPPPSPQPPPPKTATATRYATAASKTATTTATTTASSSRSGKLATSGGVCESLRLSYTYTIADVARRSRNMATGVLAVFLLVFFTGVAVLATTKVSYVLLRLSELSVGEVDVELRPGNGTLGFDSSADSSPVDYLAFSGSLLNLTALSPIFARSGVVVGATPRWMLRGEVAQADVTLGGSYDASSRSGDNKNSGSGTNTSLRATSPVNILVADTAREYDIGIGRRWPYRSIGMGEVHVYAPLTRLLAVRANRGERVSLYPDKAMVRALMTAMNINTVLHRPPMPPMTPQSLLMQYIFEVNNITDDSVDVLNRSRPRLLLTLADAVAESYAKYPSALANAVILDSRTLMRLLVEQSGLRGGTMLDKADNDTSFHIPAMGEMLNVDVDGLARRRIDDAAMSIALVLRDRYTMYYADTTQARDRYMAHASDALMLAAGVSLPCTVSFPVAQMMTTFDSFKSMLLSVFVVVVVGTVLLCTLLVVTLLTIHANERQFELAMLRAQGMPHARIIVLLLTQTAAFTLPATVIGVLLVLAANAVLERVLTQQTAAPARPTDLPASAAVTCVVLGVVMPFVAAVGPVRAALGGSLRDALDVYRQAQKETQVVVTRLADVGVQAWQVVLGAFLTVLGFILYYVLPLSLLSNNTLLFFALLDVVLLSFVVGMCLVVHVLEPYAESACVWLMLWGGERRLHTLVTRNLHSHRARNHKAFLTFMLTIACLTASGILFVQLADVTTRLTELQAGAQVTVTSLDFAAPLNTTAFDEYLSTTGREYAASWGYSSFALNDYPHIVSDTNMINYFDLSMPQLLICVSEFFYESTYGNMNDVAVYKDGYDYPVNGAGAKDVVQSMYTQAPYVGVPTADDPTAVVLNGLWAPTEMIGKKRRYRIPALVAHAAEASLGVGVNSGALLEYTYAQRGGNTHTTRFALEVRAQMTTLAGFPDTAAAVLRFGKSSAVLVPEAYFLTLLNSTALDYVNESYAAPLADNAVTTVRYKVLYVRLHEGATRRQREALVNALQARVNATTHLVVDTDTVKEQLATIKTTVLIFFYLIAVICIVVCGLMMWLTFIANVQLNSWSVGVLRALGFHLAQLIRASVYEALAIVLSGFVLGLGVGLIAGVVMSLQMASYQSLPMTYDVPYVVILVVFGLALLAAVCGSVLPYIAIARKPIALVLRHV